MQNYYENIDNYKSVLLLLFPYLGVINQNYLKGILNMSKHHMKKDPEGVYFNK